MVIVLGRFEEVLGVIRTCRSRHLEGVLDVLSDSEDDGRGTLVVGVLVGSTVTVEVQTFSRYLSAGLGVDVHGKRSGTRHFVEPQ